MVHRIKKLGIFFNAIKSISIEDFYTYPEISIFFLNFYYKCSDLIKKIPVFFGYLKHEYLQNSDDSVKNKKLFGRFRFESLLKRIKAICISSTKADSMPNGREKIPVAVDQVVKIDDSNYLRRLMLNSSRRTV